MAVERDFLTEEVKMYSVDFKGVIERGFGLFMFGPKRDNKEQKSTIAVYVFVDGENLDFAWIKPDVTKEGQLYLHWMTDRVKVGEDDAVEVLKEYILALKNEADLVDMVDFNDMTDHRWEG